MRSSHKYGAVATEVDGIRFPSKRQARVYCELKLRQRAGEISDLKLEQNIALNAEGGERVGFYRADFIFCEDGQLRVADAKGMRTQLYTWKRRHLKAQYGVDIIEL